MHLGSRAECRNIEEILDALKAHLKKNHRLTPGLIFSSLDQMQQDMLSHRDFTHALERVGIKLHQKEFDIICGLLDQNNDGSIKYKPLVQELQGVPQKMFINREISRLA